MFRRFTKLEAFFTQTILAHLSSDCQWCSTLNTDIRYFDGRSASPIASKDLIQSQSRKFVLRYVSGILDLKKNEDISLGTIAHLLEASHLLIRLSTRTQRTESFQQVRRVLRKISKLFSRSELPHSRCMRKNRAWSSMPGISLRLNTPTIINMSTLGYK